ncbi:MAG: helix-turn-helix transcriptional regulator [Smithella sp.]
MTPLQRKIALIKLGITQKSIAEKIGVAEMTVSDVVKGKRISDRTMKAVAEAIGKDYRVVFPEYYLQPPKRSTSKVNPV